MLVLIDSSVFISFFNSQDINHRDTIKLFEKFSKDKSVGLILPVLVFLEVTYVLGKQGMKVDEDEMINIFTTAERIDLDYVLTKIILPIMKSLNLKTSDAVIVAIAKLTESKFITWDKKLQKEAAKIVKTLTPKEFFSSNKD